MKAIVKVLVPVTLAFGALAAQAGTIETDYPTNVLSTASAAGSAPAQAEPFLVQSNNQGITENRAVRVGPAMQAEMPAERGPARGPALEKGASDLGYFA